MEGKQGPFFVFLGLQRYFFYLFLCVFIISLFYLCAEYSKLITRIHY